MRMILSFLMVLCTSLAQAATLVSDEEHQRLLSGIPEIEAADLEEKIQDPRLIFYDENVIPKMFQFSSGAHSAYHNIAAQPDPTGNAALDFPWRFPSGTDYDQSVRTFKALWLPAGEKIVWWQGRAKFDKDRPEFYQWAFPTGTVFFEFLYINIDGEDYPWEIRVRERMAEHWEPRIFRPFIDKESLEKALGREVAITTKETLISDTNPTKIFRSTRLQAFLPKIEKEETIRLLTTTSFFEATGIPFAVVDGKTINAATTEYEGQIVPRKYFGSHLDIDAESCSKCHATTATYARHWSPSRDWYGTIPGGDQAFSWHPFDPDTISGNGGHIAPRFRQEFLSILERYDPAKHKERKRL